MVHRQQTILCATVMLQPANPAGCKSIQHSACECLFSSRLFRNRRSTERNEKTLDDDDAEMRVWSAVKGLDDKSSDTLIKRSWQTLLTSAIVSRRKKCCVPGWSDIDGSRTGVHAKQADRPTIVDICGKPAARVVRRVLSAAGPD